MADGRLTPLERRRIARGLLENLSYAEIGRRLGRPTSTVAREVSRNGGVRGYRADVAQRATEQRAQRRRLPLVEGTRSPRHIERRDDVVSMVEDALVPVLVASGLPRTPARILASLLLADSGSMTAAQLRRRLSVSAATISKGITFLESQTLVFRAAGERRRDIYVVDDNLLYRSTVATTRANQRLIDTALAGAKAIGSNTSAAIRLTNIARFLALINTAITTAAEHARSRLT